MNAAIGPKRKICAFEKLYGKVCRHDTQTLPPEKTQLTRDPASQESRPLLWRELAREVPGRTNKDCRRRWCNVLAGGMAKGSWTESEDERLSRAVDQLGPKWVGVADLVRTRNSDQCASHWTQILSPDINYSDFTPDEVRVWPNSASTWFKPTLTAGY